MRGTTLALNKEAGTFAFKHRTFAEFLYAKFLDKKPWPKLTDKIFDGYWINTLYFYVGLKKDCPELLSELINSKAHTEAQLLSKACNTANFLLAGYATPYGVIKEGVISAAQDMARLYVDVVKRGTPSLFSDLPEIKFLWLLQFLFKRAYGYTFLKSALADAALELAVKQGEDEERAYALFFLNVTHLNIGGDQQFDFVLKSNVGEKLPLDILLGMRHESEKIKRNVLLKKMDQKFEKWLKGNIRLKKVISDMYEKPIKDRKVLETKAGKALS